MAIPGIPQNMYVQSQNQQILISWDLSAGATSYIVQRSQDNITFTTLATLSGSPLATSYLDSSPTLATMYYYQVAAVNTSGTSPYSQAQSGVAVQAGEMCLSQIRLAAQQRADRVNSNFVTLPEWNNYINQAMFELYDILVTLYEDLYVAPFIQFTCDGTTFLYPLPNGSNTFTNPINGQTVTPPAFYKLIGVDLALQNVNNAYVTINKFMFADRNKFVYPNTASTIYGVFNMQYRLLGSNIEFIPTPSAGQSIRLCYIPRMTALLQDTDVTITGISGWIEYVIVKAAYYALTKEESPTDSLVMQLTALTDRINSSASNRDAGIPEKISDARANSVQGTGYGSYNGSSGGWAIIPLLPIVFANDITDHCLSDSILIAQTLLGSISFCVLVSYFLYLHRSKFRGWVSFSRTSDFFSDCLSIFHSHVGVAVRHGAQKQVIKSYTRRIVTFMTNAITFWNSSDKLSPGYARCKVPFSTYGKSSSSVFMLRACPDPAVTYSRYVNWYRTISINFHPKSFFYSKFCFSHKINNRVTQRNAK